MLTGLAESGDHRLGPVRPGEVLSLTGHQAPAEASRRPEGNEAGADAPVADQQRSQPQQCERSRYKASDSEVGKQAEEHEGSGYFSR